MFTIIINYPTELEPLRRWAKRLFAVYYACGAIGTTCIVAGIVLGLAHKSLTLGVAAFGILLGAPMNAAESLLAEVDRRRIALINGEHPTD